MSTIAATNLKNPDSASNNIVLGTDGGVTVSTIQGILKHGTVINWHQLYAYDFVNIPSWVKRITVMYEALSTNGTSQVQIQLGTSVGYSSTSYTSSSLRTSATGVNTATSSTGITTDGTSGTANFQRYGSITLSKFSGDSNKWAVQGVIHEDTNAVSCVGGLAQLSGTLAQIRITPANATDQFDTGSVNILYEG